MAILNKLMLLSLWGGVVALDTTAVLQVLVSHPMVSCSVVGFILGQVKIGFLIGVVLELVWLNELPIGAAPFSEGNIGATVAASVAILVIQQINRMEVVIPLACFAGIGVSTLGGHGVILVRRLNNVVYTRLIESPAITPGQIVRVHALGMFIMFAGGFVLTAVATALAYLLLMYLVPQIPVAWDVRLWPILGAFLGVGCAVLLYMFVTKKNWWLLIVGAALGALFLIE
jgi:mannose/fructose/N-acetylgalactosamine-specific phosphotransferase system component IIC